MFHRICKFSLDYTRWYEFFIKQTPILLFVGAWEAKLSKTTTIKSIYLTSHIMVFWCCIVSNLDLSFILHFEIVQLDIGCKHGKVDHSSALVCQNHIVIGQRPKSIVNFSLFSWWILLLCKILKCRISSKNLQNLSLKVVLKSKYLNLVLDVDFMTLNILKLEFFSYYFNSLSIWGHHHETL